MAISRYQSLHSHYSANRPYSNKARLDKHRTDFFKQTTQTLKASHESVGHDGAMKSGIFKNLNLDFVYKLMNSMKR
jgi:hypothetical protein